MIKKKSKSSKKKITNAAIAARDLKYATDESYVDKKRKSASKKLKLPPMRKKRITMTVPDGLAVGGQKQHRWSAGDEKNSYCLDCTHHRWNVELPEVCIPLASNAH